MNSTIVYNLRNRAVYSTVFTSFLEGIVSFLENYKEFLTKEHSLLLLYLNSSTLIEGDNIKRAFRSSSAALENNWYHTQCLKSNEKKQL